MQAKKKLEEQMIALEGDFEGWILAESHHRSWGSGLISHNPSEDIRCASAINEMTIAAIFIFY